MLTLQIDTLYKLHHRLNYIFWFFSPALFTLLNRCEDAKETNEVQVFLFFYHRKESWLFRFQYWCLSKLGKYYDQNHQDLYSDKNYQVLALLEKINHFLSNPKVGIQNYLTLTSCCTQHTDEAEQLLKALNIQGVDSLLQEDSAQLYLQAILSGMSLSGPSSLIKQVTAMIKFNNHHPTMLSENYQLLIQSCHVTLYSSILLKVAQHNLDWVDDTLRNQLNNCYLNTHHEFLDNFLPMEPLLSDRENGKKCLNAALEHPNPMLTVEIMLQLQEVGFLGEYMNLPQEELFLRLELLMHFYLADSFLSDLILERVLHESNGLRLLNIVACFSQAHCLTQENIHPLFTKAKWLLTDEANDLLWEKIPPGTFTQTLWHSILRDYDEFNPDAGIKKMVSSDEFQALLASADELSESDEPPIGAEHSFSSFTI